MTQPTQPTPPQRPMYPVAPPAPPSQQFQPGWPTTDPKPPAPLAPAAAKKSGWYKSKVAIGIGALLLGLILGSASANGSKGTAAAASTVTITGAPGGTITQQVTTTATVATTVTAQPAPPAGTFKDGTFLVNKEIKPGQYRTANASGSCYWERMKDTENTLESIIANGNPTGPGIVTIKATDVAFTSARCGEWQPV